MLPWIVGSDFVYTGQHPVMNLSVIYLHVPIISFAVENQVEKRFRNAKPEVIPSMVLGNTTNSSGYTLTTRYESLRRSHKTNGKLFTVCKCTSWQSLWILRSFFEILARFLNEQIRLYYTIRPGNIHPGLPRARWHALLRHNVLAFLLRSPFCRLEHMYDGWTLKNCEACTNPRYQTNIPERTSFVLHCDASSGICLNRFERLSKPVKKESGLVYLQQSSMVTLHESSPTFDH